MNAKIALFTALIAVAGAGSAFAAEGTQDFPAGGISSATRAEVRAQIGTPSYGEASEMPVAKSTQARSQVAAEARTVAPVDALFLGE